MPIDTNTLLTKGVAEVIVKENLEARLAAGEKLRVKLGIDPTAPDLHLGHTVPLRKLRQLQNAGHKAVLIIGDFTAMIGDPSGRAGAREPLTKGAVQENLKKFLSEAGKIIDVPAAEVRYNSEWLAKLTAEELVQLQAKFTVQQLTQREDFSQRLAADKPVSAHELLYPMFQAYDSVMVKADVELGGLDQKLNLIAGRHLMEKMGLPAQDIILVPLLEGTDGVKKMSKSVGNYIAIDDEPNEMFGKIMAVPDGLVAKYFELLTDEAMPQTENPRDAKLALGKIIVGMYHDAAAGEAAEEYFLKVFSRKEAPEDMRELRITNNELGIMELLVAAGVESKNEARRLIEQGGVRLDDEVKKDAAEVVKIQEGSVLQIGKRKFFKIKI